MSYFGWNGKDMIQADEKLLGALIALRSSGIDKNLLIELNDSGRSFEEIADFLDKRYSERKPMYGMQRQ
jgi:hypothetical protein